MKTEPPPPRELVRAFRTLKRLARAIPYSDEVRDPDGRNVWEGLVEGRRQIAVATSYLGIDDESYQQAWDRMLKE